MPKKTSHQDCAELKQKYKHANAAANANAAIYMLESVASMLEMLPRVDEKLSNTASKWTESIRKERQRMLEIMDSEHEKAGTPYPHNR